MGLSDRGQTTYQEYDFDEAINRRWEPIEAIGTSQTNYVREAAQRRLAIQQQQEQARWATAMAQSQQANQGNQQRLDSAGRPIPLPAYQSNRQQQGSSNYQPPQRGGSFGSFMNAISSQESGNNYGARNPMSGAAGKYQIMPFNINGSGGWDREALGYNISMNQFMASPEIQEKIAQFKLEQYYNRYGPAGAAIAWYAGPGAAQKYVRTGRASSRGEAGGYPSISGYMQSILRKMGLA